MFIFILQLSILILEIITKCKTLSNQQEYITSNIYKITLDEQFKQIISISNPKNFNSDIGVLVEQQNETYKLYIVKNTQFFDNNEFHPNFDIVKEVQLIPKQGEKCYGFIFEVVNSSIFCLLEQELRFYRINDLNDYESYDLNYNDHIYTIEFMSNNQLIDSYVGIFINLHISNWEIQVFYISVRLENNRLAKIFYGSQDFKDQPDLKVKKAIIQSYSAIHILTTNNNIYVLIRKEIHNFHVNKKINQQILDFGITKKGLHMITRMDNICQLNQLTFDCFSNDFQFLIFDSQFDYYLIENKSQIISPQFNITIDQYKFYFLPYIRLLITHNNSSVISLYFLQKINNIQTYQNIDQEYEYDDSFFNQSHIIEFTSNYSTNFKLTPFKFGPPFNVQVLDDESQLISNIDYPDNYRTCLNGTEQSYQFLKMITSNEFVYQQNNEVYYLNCQFHNPIYIMLQSNDQIIQHFESYYKELDLFIYFDEGMKLNVYKVSKHKQINEYYLIQLNSIYLEKQIKIIQKQFNHIIIQHIDESQTLLLYNDKIKNIQSYQLSGCEFAAKVNQYFLCAYNLISHGILELLYIESQKEIFHVNRYNSDKILDLTMIKEDELIIIIKDDQGTKIRHYLIQNERFYILGDIFQSTFQPQRFVNIFDSIYSVLALNKLSELYLVVYNLTMDSSKQLMRFIPYPKNFFSLNQNSVNILKPIIQENAWNIENYQFDKFSLRMQTIYQQKYKQNYTVTLQIDNLLSQQQIQLHFVGLDNTGQLYQKENNHIIQLKDKSQKINFNEYIYGPIHQLVCTLNCKLKKMIIQKNSVKFDKIISKSAIIVGDILILYHLGNHFITDIKNNFNLTVSNIVVRDSYFINYGIIQSPDSTVPDLIAVIYYSTIMCQLRIDIYSQQQELLYVNQFDEELSKAKCYRLRNIKLKHNIFFISEKGYLIVYQYNFNINQFDLYNITSQINGQLSFQDHYIFEDQLYLCGINNSINIIKIDLNTELIVFKYFYERELQFFGKINIIKANDNKIDILYIHYNQYPYIYHLQIKECIIDSVSIQELVVDSSFIMPSPTYFDDNKILFRLLQMNQDNIQYYTLLYYIENEQEDYIFSSELFYSIDQILHASDNKYIYINQTSIGYIEINNFQEIQVYAQEFEIEVSNMQNVVRIIMRTSRGYSVGQLIMITIFLGILILFQLFVTRYNNKNNMKYNNLY